MSSSWPAKIGAAYLALLCFVLGAGPWLMAPPSVDVARRLQAPGAGAWLGTDELGRDVFARLVFGGRVSLFVAVTAAAISIALGAALGARAGARGGAFDRALASLIAMISAVPRMPLLLFVAGLGVGADGAIGRLLVILLALGWVSPARVARSSAHAVAGSPFVTAARALGLPARRVFWSHVWPNVRAPLVPLLVIEIGAVLVYESVLSYLGIGIPASIGSWGAMMRAGPGEGTALVIAPGVLSVLTILSLEAVARALARREAT